MPKIGNIAQMTQKKSKPSGQYLTGKVTAEHGKIIEEMLAIYGTKAVVCRVLLDEALPHVESGNELHKHDGKKEYRLSFYAPQFVEDRVYNIVNAYHTSSHDVVGRLVTTALNLRAVKQTA